MNITEKYWLTILLTFCRYVSIIMIGGGAGFIPLGIYVSPWFFIGLAVWPLLIMWGVVNLRYVRALVKVNRLEFSKITERVTQ